MGNKVYIKRHNIISRVFHLGIMLTFLLQAATGFSRMFITTKFGKILTGFFGGYDMALKIHFWGGILMILVFVLHVIYLFINVDWKNWKKSIFGPDSMIPNLQDARHLLQRVLWFFGLNSPPRLERWAYWEKFGYWAVFWGVPILGVTGLMLYFPLLSSRVLPGWILNIAALFHRAEALLAVTFIFIVHFIFGHLAPSKFPMSEVIFSGSEPLDEIEEERPAWLERLQKEGKIETATVQAPSLYFRIVYFIFGLSAFGCGVWLLINGIIYSRYIQLH